MSRSASVRSPRRNLHDERREDTRARLLDATLESLVAVGYARTSTTEIADRAGISRGAQVYHYPSKAALVAAAVERLLERRYEEVKRLFEELPPGADGASAAIDLLWRMFEGPTFAAWLEFVNASRTDPELRAAVVLQTEPFVKTVGETLRKSLPTIAWNPLFRRPDFVFALLDGLALARFLYPEDDRSTRMVATLRDIAEQVQPRTADKPRARRTTTKNAAARGAPGARRTKKSKRAP
jgi:AcrR family transcriptional regulator